MSSAKPAPVHLGALRIRAVRGPREDGRWYWRAQVYDGGREATAWTMWASRGEVELRAARELIAPTVKATPPPPTVADVLDRWLAMKEADPHLRDKSKAAYRQAAQWLVAQLGGLEPHEVTAEALRRLVAESGLAPMSLRQRFGILFHSSLGATL